MAPWRRSCTCDRRTAQNLAVEKSLYGLKNAGRIWNDLITTHLIEKCRSVGSRSDQCVLLRKSCILFLYVDDILLIHKPGLNMSSWLNLLLNRFTVKEVQLVNGNREIIGFELVNRSQGLSLCQRGYVNSLVHLHADELSVVRRVATPMATAELDPLSTTLSTDASARYKSLVGAILYAGGSMCPDIS